MPILTIPVQALHLRLEGGWWIGRQPGARRRHYDLVEPYWSASDGFSGVIESAMQAAIRAKMLALLDE